MTQRPRGVLSTYLYLSWIVIRVVITLVFWLALILGTFIGYMTIPVFLVTTVLVVLAINDATGFMARRRGGRKRGR